MNIPDTYDNNRKFIFTNWTSEDFDVQWGGENFTIKVGETQEFPMAQAYHFTKHLVDREMSRTEKASLMGVDEERVPFERKTIAEISAGTDSPALATLKEQIRKEVEAEEAKGEEVMTEKKSEFEEIKESVEQPKVEQPKVEQPKKRIRKTK